ncbi:hypothetical protein SDC9_175408 [bioreactor metagenome]|jgi:uncharacterized membrane protein|uniref:DUF1269 domain-containing protein n=2 Tax=root TaxID=1 RepID=A0AAN0K6T5_9ACTN|nr:DUF1269 domain-containing protein [Brooklawnia sp. SH051]MEA5121665.1 DUF1269 domain-containing protein [Propionibacterium sp.]NLI85877.1 DUF1269 domain-containing protein [Propionibacterium sp.]BEH02245.1 DUF1269 domain-containing protein [Brooklawnia sp. SH051]
MSELIIIGYDDHATAEAAQARVLQLQKDFVIDLSGLAVVRVDDDGKKHIDTPGSIVGVSATSGALWGMIIGLLFLVPGVGLLVGGAWGALAGLAGKAGINRSLRERVDGLLTPGKSALVVMAKKLTEDKFAAAMAEFGGTVLKTSLSDEAENELVQELKN